MREWLASLSRPAQFAVLTALAVIANVIVVGIISLIIGGTDVVAFSNALFYDSAIVFLVALILHFTSRGDSPRRRLLRRASEDDDGHDDDKHEESASPLSFYSTVLIVAGLIIFGLSIGVTLI